MVTCKKDEKDDSVKNLALLYLVQQQQIASAAAAKAAAIAAKPGCKSLIELTGTGVSNAKSLSGKSTSSNEIAIRFTVTSTTQKLIFTGTNLPSTASDRGRVYPSDACTSGSFTTATSITPSTNSGNTQMDVTFSAAGTYLYYWNSTTATGESVYAE